MEDAVNCLTMASPCAQMHRSIRRNMAQQRCCPCCRAVATNCLTSRHLSTPKNTSDLYYLQGPYTGSPCAPLCYPSVPAALLQRVLKLDLKVMWQWNALYAVPSIWHPFSNHSMWLGAYRILRDCHSAMNATLTICNDHYFPLVFVFLVWYPGSIFLL